MCPPSRLSRTLCPTRVAGTVLVAAFLVLLGASTAAWAAPTAPKRLLVLGDSVLAGVPASGQLSALEQALPGWEITFDAKECRSIQGTRKACGDKSGTVDGGLEALQRHGVNFDAVVVQLGTNDAADPASAQTTIASAQAILALLRDVPHVYWLTIREAGHYAAGYAAFNEQLRKLPATHPNLTVVDWAAATKDQPQLFASDGLHLNNAGAHEAAAVIAAAVEEKLPATVPTIAPTPAPPSSTSPATSGSSTSTTAAAVARDVGSLRTSDDSSTNIVIGVVVGLALLAGIVVAVLAGRRRERRHRREERTARVEAELARNAPQSLDDEAAGDDPARPSEDDPENTT